MNAPKPNEQMLLAAVEKLAPLLDQLVSLVVVPRDY